LVWCMTVACFVEHLKLNL